MPEETSNNIIIPAGQMAQICRWGRVAVTVRSAWRVAIRFHPDVLRDPVAATAGVMALDACTSMAAVAAANGRQLAQPVTEAAATAMLTAQTAPDQVPLSASDHAAMLAAVSVLMCGTSAAPAALECGNPDNFKAAVEDIHWLTASGLTEEGYDYAVPRDFFARRLWPKTPPGWDRELEDWERRLAPLGQLDFSERLRWMRTGRGIDWTFAQRRAEAWVRANLAKWSAEQMALRPQPPKPARPPQTAAPFLPPSAPPLPSPRPPATAAAATVVPTSSASAFDTPPTSSASAFDTPATSSARAFDAPATSSARAFDAPATSGARAFDAPPTSSGSVLDTPAMPEHETYLPRPLPLPNPPPDPVAADSVEHSALSAVIEATQPPPAPVEPTPDLAPSLRIPDGGPFDFSDLEPWANALCGIIDFLDPRSTMTLAIQGPPGSGRSVLGGMVRRRLAAKPSASGLQPHLTFWFDASKPRDQPVMSAALLGELAAALDKERPFWQRHKRRLAWSLLTKGDRYRQIFSMVFCVLAMLGIAAIAGVLVGPLNPPDWAFSRREFVNWSRAVDFHHGPTAMIAFFGVIFMGVALELFGSIARMGGALARYVRHPEGAQTEASKERVRAEIATLIEQAVPKGSRMVIFVEDPERAGPARSVEFLEHLDDFLDRPQLAKILLTDSSALAEHARARHQRQFGTLPDAATLKRQLGRFIDLQVNLPARGAAGETRPKRGGRDSGKGRRKSSVESARGFDAFTGMFSREWRGSAGFLESLRRSMYVDPPYVSPVSGMWWLCMFLPGAVFASVQRWFYPPRCRRLFSVSTVRVWHLLLGVTLAVQAVLVVQTLNAMFTGRYFVILLPRAHPQSVWVFLPLGILNLFVVAFAAVWSAFAARRAEVKALKSARATLRRKIQELRAISAPEMAQELAGATRVPNEQHLIREAVEECYLPSTKDSIARLELFMELSKNVV